MDILSRDVSQSVDQSCAFYEDWFWSWLTTQTFDCSVPGRNTQICEKSFFFAFYNILVLIHKDTHLYSSIFQNDIQPWNWAGILDLFNPQNTTPTSTHCVNTRGDLVALLKNPKFRKAECIQVVVVKLGKFDAPSVLKLQVDLVSILDLSFSLADIFLRLADMNWWFDNCQKMTEDRNRRASLASEEVKPVSKSDFHISS